MWLYNWCQGNSHKTQNRHTIFGPMQTGFLKGRFIGRKHCFRSCSLFFQISHPYGYILILLLYFEKTFHKVEWNFLNSVLSRFGFIFMNWVKVFYNSGFCMWATMDHLPLVSYIFKGKWWPKYVYWVYIFLFFVRKR